MYLTMHKPIFITTSFGSFDFKSNCFSSCLISCSITGIFNLLTVDAVYSIYSINDINYYANFETFLFNFGDNLYCSTFTSSAGICVLSASDPGKYPGPS